MKLNRREFLALTGKTAAGAVIFAACGLPERELIVQSPVDLPEDLVRGEDAWFATSMGDFSNGDGVLVRVMQGRAKKIEGNPDHPITRGKATARYDAVLQLLYHPDRIAEPQLRYSKAGNLVDISWDQADARFKEALSNADGALTVVTNPLRGHLGAVATNFAAQYNGKHMAFDPVEQGVLHGAVKSVLGQDQLPTFDIANAQTVLSFGADWLGTWGSPVQFGVKYGEFREQDDRGYFIHAEPRMSLTAAAADLWLAPVPGTEGHLALAIASVIIEEGLASPQNVAAFEAAVPGGVSGVTLSDAAARTGVDEHRIEKAAKHFAEHTPSVAFGGGSAGAHTNGSFNLGAIFALNILVGAVDAKGGVTSNPGSAIDGLSASATGASFADWEAELAEWRAGNVETVIIRGADIVHGMPNSVAIREALEHVPNVIAFGAVLDDTMDFADLVLPEETFLESWGIDIPEPGPGYQVVGTQQPVVGPTISHDESGLISDARGFGDTLLDMSDGSYGRDMESLVRGSLSDLHDTGRGSVSASSAALFTNGALQRGGWWDTSKSGSASTGRVSASRGSASYSSTDGTGEGTSFHLVPFVSNSLGDGKLAAAPWAQQTPDPISSASWSTWAEINSIQADELGIKEGDVLRVRSTSGEIEALAYPHPGVRPGVIGIPMGQGHHEGGRYAKDRGSNVLSILVDEKDAETGALAWAATRVTVQRAGKRVKVPKFEGNVVARPVEPGVPVLVVGVGETAHDAQEANHHEYQKQFLLEGEGADDHE
ncbi:MAG: molybdopterin-dependent oxidoreductase [Chloroflexi bacterium]|jgi:menaquinone reductase, molybdopterin-binding-like subunit|nr:molybdopterin-dependent oxidoreductase [Chloroflexota bacterium]